MVSGSWVDIGGFILHLLVGLAESALVGLVPDRAGAGLAGMGIGGNVSHRRAPARRAPWRPRHNPQSARSRSGYPSRPAWRSSGTRTCGPTVRPEPDDSSAGRGQGRAWGAPRGQGKITLGRGLG